METRVWRGPLAAVVVLTLFVSPITASGNADPTQWTFLAIDGQQARIFRDAYGVPHVFAPTNRSLFYAYGYAIAQDRLWQLDLSRRTARGTMSEVLGPASLPSDRAERLHGYTEPEYQSLFASMPSEAQDILNAYRDGINAYLDLVAADTDNRLPWEFHQLGYRPDPWEVTDTLAIGRFMARRFGESATEELQNQALLQSLMGAHGTITGTAIFEDVRWLNDPDAPASTGSADSDPASLVIPRRVLPGIDRIATQVADQQREVAEIWTRYGMPTTLGSYAWAVSPKRSASHQSLLYGGPQMGWSTPDIIHEIQLSGGRGFDVIGVGFTGIPLVLIGHNRSVAWSVTTGMGDNADIYVERLNPSNPDEYWYNDSWNPMVTREVTVAVRGWETPFTETVRRTVHGPVIALDEPNGLAYSVRRAHWMREHRMLGAFLDLVRAQVVDEFERGLEQLETSNHFLYADADGNIAYWQAGAVPIRPGGGHVGLLPWAGDGSEEWTGAFRSMPHVLNPEQGYLVNWNNKASPDFDNGDGVLLGKQDRVSDIEEILAGDDDMSWDDMQQIPVRIAALKFLGNETRYLRVYLLAAIASEAPDDERLQEIASRLLAWDGRGFADAVDGTQSRPEEEIWSAWLSRALLNTFGDELGSSWNEADLNTLLHVLDGLTSRVPPSRDYFDRVGTAAIETSDEVLVQALREALHSLAERFGTPSVDAWTTPWPPVPFQHPLGPVLGQMLIRNRATYGQIVEMSKPIKAWNVVPLGQSGFIDRGGVPDSHFGDQLTLYREFEYKPMRLVTAYTAQLPLVVATR